MICACGIEFDEKTSLQGGVCAICHGPETAMRDGKLYKLSVDHDHVTGAVRGLLCSRCNIGVGSFGDNSERLVSAALYLLDGDADRLVTLASYLWAQNLVPVEPMVASCPFL